ncbi:MAG: ATP-binding protein, partial [Bacteroidota bacterium]
FKESMHNTLKHAEANYCELSIQQTKTGFKLSFEDHGKGIQLDHPQKGRGLLNMQARAAKIPGELEIQSTRRGTKISLTW